VNHAAQEPKAIAKAPEGEGCPRCGGYVYAAEQMLARGRVSILTIAMLNYIYNWGFLPSHVRLDTCISFNIRSYYTIQHNWVAVVIFFIRVMKVWQIMTSNDSISAMKSILDSSGSQFTDVSGQQLLCFGTGAEMLKSGIHKGRQFYWKTESNDFGHVTKCGYV